jgi:hypothetical protein
MSSARQLPIFRRIFSTIFWVEDYSTHTCILKIILNKFFSIRELKPTTGQDEV